MNWKETLKNDLNVYEFSVVLPGSKEEIKYRPLITKDFKKLLIYENTTDPRILEEIFDEILETSIITENVNIDEMFIFDRNFLLFDIRRNSKGSKIELPIHICPKCKSQSKHVYDLSKIEIKDKKENIEYNIKLTDNISIELDFIRRKDMKLVYNELNKYEKDEDKLGEIFTLTYAASIKNIIVNDEKIDNISLMDKKELVESLPTEIFQNISNWFEENMFGLSSFIDEKKCLKCEYIDKIEIDLSKYF